ncbi:MAG: hypothetical protein WBA07_13735 [Rivularia sp. (in: cyanobacteria)]|jgi:hypothetical protein
MNPFKHYETEKLISICFSDSISKLNSQQLSQLLNELETRRQQIENDLANMGVPSDAIIDPQKRQSFKIKFNQRVDLLGYIDKIINS